MRSEIRITGFGGQGIILAGYIVGKAAAVFDGKNATMVQAYGPEARGSACSSQTNELSHVLLALGLENAEARGSLRLSLGKNNTMGDIDFILQRLPRIIKRLRAISPLGIKP